MIDRTKFTEHELELLDIVVEYFPVAFELSINTQDGDLFENLMNKANKILVEKTLNGLVNKGYVEIVGVDENGEFTFSLTEKGKLYSENIMERRAEDGPTL